MNFYFLFQGDGWDKLVYKIAYFIDWSKPGAHRDSDGVIPAYINGNFFIMYINSCSAAVRYMKLNQNSCHG